MLLVPPVALALGACQADPATNPAGVDPHTGVVTAPSPLVQDPQGQDPGSIQAQRTRLLVEQYLEEARKLRQEGKLEEARGLALRARDLAPQDQRTLQLLDQISADLGEGAAHVRTFAEQQERLAQIREERARAEVQGRLDSARQQMARGNYSGAIQELRAANLSIEVGSAFDWGPLADAVRTTLAEAEAKRDEALRAEQERTEREIAQRLREAERAERVRRQRRVAELTREAMTAFERRQFRAAQEAAFEAMRIDPTDETARNVHNAAIKAERERRDDDYYKAKVREWARMKERDLDLKIPQTDILRIDQEVWERASARAAAAAPEETDTIDDQLRQKVQSTMVDKLSFTEETGAYRDVIKVLQTRTDVPIIITPEARAVIDAESLIAQIEIVSPISLANFLTWLANRSEQLAWTVRNGVVEFTTKAKAGGANIVKTYDIRDLVFPLTDFIPPVLRDLPSGDSSGPRTGGEADETTSYVDPTNLKQNIQDATGAGYWDTEGGGKIDVLESGYLLVTANADMLRRVEVFLEELRRFATAIVSIESKFLTISQNFLQEIGVDFRGLGGSGKGSVAQLDDVTNRLDDNAGRGLDNSGTGDEAGAPTSGAFFNDGGDGDVRARTENFFNNRLARNLTNTGGLTAAWSWLDDLQLQAILRAVEKRQDVQLVNSQQLSVVNSQRAHVAIINQTSFVRDYEVEVAQASFIADPKVDVIQDGVALDVRPVISYDRKHITLNLQPTVAELLLPIPTFTTSLAGSTLPVTLQLPTLTVRQFATTVTVPDGGSVLIGGLREVLTTERRAEVPFFGKLPLISFLFKQEGIADENTSLMVLIRATVTDVREHMESRR